MGLDETWWSLAGARPVVTWRHRQSSELLVCFLRMEYTLCTLCPPRSPPLWGQNRQAINLKSKQTISLWNLVPNCLNESKCWLSQYLGDFHSILPDDCRFDAVFSVWQISFRFHRSWFSAIQPRSTIDNSSMNLTVDHKEHKLDLCRI